MRWRRWSRRRTKRGRAVGRGGGGGGGGGGGDGEEGRGRVGSGRVRGKKGGQGVEASGNAMGSLPGMKYVGIDLFKA